MRCTQCEEAFENADDGRENDVGQWCCNDCYDSRYAQCSDCGDEVVRDDTFCDDGGYYCEDCVDSNYFICSNCGGREHNDCGVTIRNGDRICEGCRINNYSYCGCCNEWVHDSDWCSDCETCLDCCRCDYCGDCDRHYDDCTCNYCDDCGNHEDDCTCEECGEDEEVVRAVSAPPPPLVSPFRDSVGSPVALIERLDNSKFELLPSNVTKVLGMLDKDGTLRAGGVLGRPCTGDGGYYLITDTLRDVGKVDNPRYIYGVRSNEYDITISSASLNDAVERKLGALGLSYTYVSSRKEKVGLSFKVRKRKYRKCIEFLKFYCNV